MSMATGLRKTSSKEHQKMSTTEEKQGKIDEIRRLIGPLAEKVSLYCSDASILRCLMAQNWNVKKAAKMLNETLKWRLAYRPEEIRWEEVAQEAQTGKIYRTNFMDKQGRTVLVMRPSCQNSKSTKAQIKYLVYCMENAILNLPPGQEQMVWLVDFQGFSLSNISLKLTRETAHILQDHYPERLGLAILYNPPKFFEPFWMVVKPFLEPKTCNKVKFVYSDDHSTEKILEDLFDMEQLEAAFGGNNNAGFDINKYAEWMKQDDKKVHSISSRVNPQAGTVLDLTNTAPRSPTDSDSDSNASSNEKSKLSHLVDSEVSQENTVLIANGTRNCTGHLRKDESTVGFKPVAG